MKTVTPYMKQRQHANQKRGDDIEKSLEDLESEAEHAVTNEEQKNNQSGDEETERRTEKPI